MNVLNETANVGTCASSTRSLTWHSLDWAKCNENVRRLQARIVKATEAGRWNKVKALQWLLTHSLSGKALAVKRVTENQGKNTAGVDGETWHTPTEKLAGMCSLKRRGYSPLPLRRVYIPKSNGKLRPLGIPTIKDRAMQALYLLALDPVSETLADRNSYGFRKVRSAHDALEQCFTALGKPSKSAQWVLEADIKGCFDHISHEWMLKNIPMDKQMLSKWLKSGYVEQGSLFPTVEGTPQGGIISPTLANMVLDGLEKRLADSFPKKQTAGVLFNPKVNLIRYADDFVVTASTKEVAEKAKVVAAEFLAERGLQLSPEKTHVVHISEGFTFLGQNVRLYSDKVLVKPSKESLLRIYDKVRDIVNQNKSVEQSTLIRMLNPVIQGWVNYHRHAVSSVTFSKLDYLIWKLLWRWARRRHPGKGKQWVASRYWRRVGTRNWTFTCDVLTDNRARTSSLVYATNTAIKRHVKVQAELNPYSTDWENYLTERHLAKGADQFNGRARLLSLWKAQEGLCPECGEPITRQTPLHVHHVVHRENGGGNEWTNLVLLHKVCHQKVHANE